MISTIHFFSTVHGWRQGFLGRTWCIGWAMLALGMAIPAQAAFTINGDGTVTDTTTGLVWDRCAYGLTDGTCSSGIAVQVNWSNALKTSVIANNGAYLGFTDWRLPNRNELESLVKIDASFPAIDAVTFPNTPFTQTEEFGWFWTNTSVAPGPSNAWHVGFGDGNTFNFGTSNLGYVRLVRSGQSWASFDLLAGPPTAPSAPIIGTATPGNAQASVNFAVPVSNGGSAITGYKATSTPDGFASNGCSSSPCNVTGLTNGIVYTFTVKATNSVGDSPSSMPSNSVIPSAQIAATRLVNLSTRGQVQTGNNVMIGGFIIGGSTPKKVLVRAVGPNLANYGVSGVLANPMLELHRSSDGSIIASNDDWGGAANSSDIQATGLAPVNSLESAILVTLDPGAYTAIVSGNGGGTGVGIVEVYDIDHPEIPLINISTRGQVQTGDNVMIGGFIIQGTSNQTVLIRAVGPNLLNYGVTGVLADPMLELHRSSDGAIIASNDNWQTASNAAAIQATGLAPVSPLESAILISLSPGAYTAIVSGANGGTGVGIIEVFAQ